MALRLRLLAGLSLFLLSASCAHAPLPEEMAGRTAKAYYDQLFQGRYDEFVDGRYFPDSIPRDYRQQLIDNARMFVDEQLKSHQGIRKLRMATVTIDTARHTANVFLNFAYGDGTNEQVLVPMVEHGGVWYRR